LFLVAKLVYDGTVVFCDRFVDKRSRTHDKFDRPDLSDPYGIAAVSQRAAANTLICLINHATYLPKWRLEKLGQSFLQESGFTERLYQARQATCRAGNLTGQI
jgi:four helix bundle suffix protein